MISFSCSGCGKNLKVKEDLAGKKGKCPQCGQSVAIPPVAVLSARAVGAAVRGEASGFQSPGLRPGVPTSEGATVAPLSSPLARTANDGDTVPPHTADSVHAKLPTPPAASSEPSSAGAAKHSFTFLAPARQPGELGWLGTYRVLRVLGAGGMGVVFQAEDTHLQRSVALKVMLPNLAADGGNRQRFLREARAAAAIEHDHIVTIYQVGEDRDVPFLAMQFLKGESLRDRLKREGRLPAAEVLRIGREMAEGLAAAHERGLIHRDIKPDNVWLERDRGRVKILDFGLAKAAADTSHLTQSGAIIGTPAYMAPEQAGGQTPDPRSDLFSLGCVLYQLCTGKSPFERGDLIGTLAALAIDNPPPPHDVQPGVPRALSALIVRLLAKKPAGRPASARSVVDSLKNMVESLPPRSVSQQESGPSSAKGVATQLRSVRQDKPRSRRHLVVCALCVLALAGWFAAQIVIRIKHPDGSETTLQVPQGTSAEIDGEGNVSLTLRPKTNLPVSATKPPGKSAAPSRSVPAAPADALGRDHIPPDALAAAGGGDATKAPAELVAILGDSRLNHWASVRSVSYSPDGKTLATASFDGTACLWDPSAGKFLRSIDGHKERVHAVSFSPDGETLATGGEDRTVKLWEPASGRLRLTLEKQPGLIHSVAFSPDGQLLAGAVHHGPPGVRIWEVATGRLRTAFNKLPDEKLCSVAFSPDGKSLAAGGGRWWGPAEGKGWVRLYDLDTNQERHVLKSQREIVLKVAFSTDGKVLASTGYDPTVRLWDSATGQEVRPLKGHGSWVTGVAFSPDGKTLATGSHDIRLWDVGAGKERARLGGYFWFADALAFSPDGRILASANSDQGAVRLWDVAAGRELPVSTGHNRSVMHLAICPDGKTLASGGYEDPVRLWDVATGRQRRVLKGHGWGLTTATAFSPDGNVLASAGNDRTIRLWDVATGGALKTLTGHESQVTSLAFSGDGQTLASGSDDKTVRLWDMAKGEAWVRLEGHTATVRAVALSPDGKTLASAGNDKTLRLWDLTKNQMRVTLEGHQAAVRSVAFARDGQTLISAGDDKTIKLWDLTKNQIRLTLEGHTAEVRSVALSPDGQTLASSGADGTVRLRDVGNGRPRETIQVGPRRGEVNQVAFTPDGHHLVTANGNGTIYVLRLTPPPERPGN